MNSNADYEALHKFLLPNMKLQDVLVDMNEFKNAPAQPEKPKEIPPLESNSKPEDDKREVEKKSRKQKRLQDRTRSKILEKNKKEEQKTKLSKEKLEERLNQIKQSVKDSKKTEGMEEKDVKRLTRVIFGDGK